ncbi:hypothetical protein BC832DRAFT_475159 [Gaertneriomyces semiglobifer]|nr:hypothetical protein BC832DRAFT_475159 [Gaertneriomyces semiglobifer]
MTIPFSKGGAVWDSWKAFCSLSFVSFLAKSWWGWLQRTCVLRIDKRFVCSTIVVLYSLTTLDDGLGIQIIGGRRQREEE